NREGPKSAGNEGQPSELVPVEDGQIVRMHGDGGAGVLIKRGHAAHVIDMPVGHQDALDGESLLAQLPYHPVELQSGVDDQGSGGVSPANQKAVFAEELIRENRNVQLLPEGLRGGHPTLTSCEAGVCRTASITRVCSGVGSPTTIVRVVSLL